MENYHIYNSQKIDFKSELDVIVKTVFLSLKSKGFKKFGYTFNKEVEKGIFQVVNFQRAGIVNDAQFTVNLGVCIDKLYQIERVQDVEKKYYKEYECQIRGRLKNLVNGKDAWWIIDNNKFEIANEILEYFESSGFDWFLNVNTEEKIIENFGKSIYNESNRADLDVILLIYFNDKEKGTELFNKYLSNIEQEKNEHKEYMEELAEKLGIVLK
jgi:Domain of unknown function (DUF4304)